MACTFIIETVTAVLLGAAPAALWVPLAALGGLCNAWAWKGLVAAALGRGTRRRWVPLGPAVIAAMAAVAVIGTTAGFAIVGSRASARPALPGAVATVDGRGPPVLIVSGFNSVLAGPGPAPIPGAYDEVRFSYAGIDAMGRPLPYSAADTHRSVSDLVRLLATQVSVLWRRTAYRSPSWPRAKVPSWPGCTWPRSRARRSIAWSSSAPWTWPAVPTTPARSGPNARRPGCKA